MIIDRLEGSGVRNLQPFSFSPAKHNLLFGENGSGKSSTLEAIHLLATGRSFRGARVDNLIQAGATGVGIYGSGLDADGRPRRLGYRKYRGGDPSIRIDGEDGKVSDLANALPVRFVGPGSEALLDGEPVFRRGFLDWILFHVEPSYLKLWRRGVRTLAQRNSALREGKGAQELSFWSRELSNVSERIGHLRQAAVDELMLALRPQMSSFDFLADIRIGLARSAVPADGPEMRAMEDRERSAGYSLYGFQRDDLKLRVPEGNARDVLSRGQRKVLVYALLLAEASLVLDKTGKISVLLLDDLCSELDKKNVAQVLSFALATGMQTFISVLSPDDIVELTPAGIELAMFHVEHGAIRQCR